MSSTRMVTMAVVLSFAVGLLAACADPPTPSAAGTETGADPNTQSGTGPVLGPAGWPAADYQGAITAPIDYRHSGISLAVPAADAVDQAAVTASQAYANCLSGAALCNKASGPTIVLASATASQAGQLAADGSIVPLMPDTLVYMVSWTGVTCMPSGGPPRSPGTEPKTFSCTVLNFIDAMTGKVLYSVQSPAP